MIKYNKDEKLRIIFVGVPDMALVCLSNLLENGFNIVAIVPPKKNHETYSFFKGFCLNKKLNFINFENNPNEASCIKQLKELNADIGVVCSYNQLLSKEFLQTTKLGYINCHPSLLPQYRGAMPYFHIINNGEKTSGITLHLMNEKFDTGDIVCQKTFQILPYETMGMLFNRTTYMLSDALIETLTKIENKQEIKTIKQPEIQNLKEAPKVDGNFKIRWYINTVFEIENLIKACNPFFNAFTSFRETSFKIIKAKSIKQDHDFKFGTISQADEESLIIAGKGGVLSLEVFQVGTWGVFTPNDFYKTFSPKEGEILM